MVVLVVAVVDAGVEEIVPIHFTSFFPQGCINYAVNYNLIVHDNLLCFSVAMPWAHGTVS